MPYAKHVICTAYSDAVIKPGLSPTCIPLYATLALFFPLLWHAQGFMSWRWRQQPIPKRWYPRTTLQGVSFQITVTVYHT